MVLLFNGPFYGVVSQFRAHKTEVLCALFWVYR